MLNFVPLIHNQQSWHHRVRLGVSSFEVGRSLWTAGRLLAGQAQPRQKDKR